MSDQSIDGTDGVTDPERAAGDEAPKVLPAAASPRDDQPDPRPTAAPRAAGTGGGHRRRPANPAGGGRRRRGDLTEDERTAFLTAVRKSHGRVDPCFMTGKGCVYTDHIDKTLRDRERDVEGQIKGFMIMPYRPRLGVFFENCLKPFFHNNYATDSERRDPDRPASTPLERADYVARPGVIVCEGICKRIQESDFVVADLSVPNDNVFYELGLAYGIGSSIVLIYHDKSEFGPMMAGYFDEEEKAFAYKGLDMIKREDFRVSDHIWTRTAPTDGEAGSPRVLFYEKTLQRHHSKFSASEPAAATAALPDKEHPDDIELTFKQHVMSDLGIALDRIVNSLRRQQDKGNDEVPGAYLKEIIEACLKEPVDIAPPDDFKDKAGDFARTRKLVDDSYCLVVRTGVDCDPMAYFWLGYGHALGKNVIPITELVIDKAESGRSRLLERTEEVGEWAEIGDRSRGKIIDLAFDIRAQRHMTFDPEHPELLEKQLERTLGEMIRADFAEWSRKKFWATLLGSRGEVSIITGGLHSEELNREMVGDWDLRAASELTSYFSRHQYRPKIETPIYQPELARRAINARSEDDPDRVTEDYVAQVIDDIGIERKNCIVIASPDVNPLTEILLGRILGVEDHKLFPTQAKGSEGSPLAGLPQHSLVVYKKRKKTSESSADKQKPDKQKPDKQKPLLRAFYAEGRGEDDVERRGFYSWAFADEVADEKGLLREYIGQHEVGSADKSTPEKEFVVLAQLIVARNPISPESGKYVVILNGVSGPGTAALTQVLTGRGNEEAELGQPRKPATTGRTQTHAFNSADKAESILNKLLPKITSKDFYCIYSVISVRVGREEHDESRDAGPDSAAHRRVGAGKTSDWRSILSWELEEGLFEDGEAVQTIHRPRSRPQTSSRDG